MVPGRPVVAEAHEVDALAGRGGPAELAAELVDPRDGAAEQAEAGDQGGERDRVRHRASTPAVRQGGLTGG
jgi:hypothetical protein